MNEIIEIKNLEKAYGKKVVLSHVNLAVPAEAFVWLQGQSGAGKTTLLNLIAGLERPTAGQVLVAGRDPSTMSARERTQFYRETIGLIFQGVELEPDLSLEENIALPGVFAGMAASQLSARTAQLTQILGITEDLARRPSEVSGGQAARAAVARALILNPKIVLADEPTANLDEANANLVLQLLQVVRTKLGVTVVVASHDARVASFATQVVTVADGQVTSETRL